MVPHLQGSQLAFPEAPSVILLKQAGQTVIHHTHMEKAARGERSDHKIPRVGRLSPSAQCALMPSSEGALAKEVFSVLRDCMLFYLPTRLKGKGVLFSHTLSNQEKNPD